MVPLRSAIKAVANSNMDPSLSSTPSFPLVFPAVLAPKVRVRARP